LTFEERLWTRSLPWEQETAVQIRADPPEIDMTIVIAKNYIEDMIKHAEQEIPNECCGVVAGIKLKKEKIVKKYTNVATC